MDTSIFKIENKQENNDKIHCLLLLKYTYNIKLGNNDIN